MKEKIFRNFTIKILSVIVALILWTVIVNIYDPSTSYTFSNVTVTLLNTQNLTDKNYSYEVVEGSKISVSVSGPKSVITDITASDIVATADLSNVSSYSDYVDIEVSVVKNGHVVEGVEATPKTTAIKLDIENRNTASFNLESQTTGTVAEGYALSKVSLNPETINVTGPSSVISSIAHAAVSIDVSNASEQLTGSTDVILYDRDYNVITDDAIELSQKSINYVADIGKTKRIPIAVESTGTPADGYVFAGLELSQNEVLIAGSSEALDRINSITIPAVNINVDGLTSNREYKFNLPNYVGNDISVISEGTLVVTVNIEPEAKKTITMDKSAIVVKNLSDDYDLEYEGSKTFDIVISGGGDAIDGVLASNIAMSIDLANCQPGVQDVPVNITVPDACKLTDSYTVTVNLKEVESVTNN